MGYQMGIRITSLVAAGMVAIGSLCSLTVAQAQQSAAQAAVPAAVPGHVVRPKYITHVVADLDKSIAFYHDGLGFDVISGPSELKASTLVQKAVSVNPLAKARAAIMRIPGAVLQLQLIQFSGIQGTPFVQHDYDPGITRLSIQLRDIYKAFNQVKDKGVSVDTTTAGPVYTQRPRNDTQAVMLRDPDGFVFEFVENAGGPAPVGEPVADSSNIFNARCSLTIEDYDASLPFYRDLLGFDIARPPGIINDAVLALEGTPRAVVRSAQAVPPGAKNFWVIWEYNGVDRVKHVPSVQDPGASSITLQVEDLAALFKRMVLAGITVVTPGGAPITLSDGHKAVLVRSPDGLLVELYE